MSLFRTEEFKLVAAAALFIALPSLALSVVSVVVLGRESASMERRLEATHTGAVAGAVRGAFGELDEAREKAESAAAPWKRAEKERLQLCGALEPLCGEGRVFSEVFIVSVKGAILRPDTGPDLLPETKPWPPDAPEDCRRLLTLAQTQEFAERNPARARRTWRALQDECSSLESGEASALLAYAMFAEARCAGKAGEAAESARLFEEMARLYPGARGEEGLPLAASALARAALNLAEAADPASAERPWTRLASWLGRNESVLDSAAFAFFLDMIEGGGSKKAVAALSSERARLGRARVFRESFSPALSRGAEPGQGFKPGYTRSLDGKQLVYAIPFQGDAAVLSVNQDSIAASFRRRAADLNLGQGMRLALADGSGKPLDPEDEPPAGFLKAVSVTFPEPLGHWRAVLSAEPPGGVRALSFLRWSMLFWVTVISAAMIAAGTFAGVRWVNRQIRLAREKSDFVSSVTHELKTPLTSIRMFSETLLTGRVSSDEERKECVQVIADETDRLTRLINRMLDFSKMERGLRRFSFSRENPESLAREAVHAFLAQGKPSPEIAIQALGPFEPLLCDRDAVIEVLINLVSNAAKYSGTAEKITLRAWSSKGRAHFAVMDRGIGIPKKEQRKIFEKFYRVDDSLTKEVEGCGLGLSISAHIAKAHGGSIQVESEPGRGSIFTLHLPEKGPPRAGSQS